MDFFETVSQRRSIRKFKPETIPDAAIEKALQAAVLAPNSSNAQTWDFYWVKSEEPKKKLIQYCLNQSAARTAAELVVITASSRKWKRSWTPLKDFVTSVNAPKPVLQYYFDYFPNLYRTGIYSCLKAAKFFWTGLKEPTMRGPSSLSQVQEVCLKSAALASENFVLALQAQGISTCMMEGFDEKRVKSLLNLGRTDRVAMVIAIGIADEKGLWGPRFRIPLEEVVHRV